MRLQSQGIHKEISC